MEVDSTLDKTFKRCAIPRSTSSVDSFTTSNNIAAELEPKSEDRILPSSSPHKHPPLSYVQHFRPLHQHYLQQNLTRSSSEQPKRSSVTRPVSEDISSFVIHPEAIDLHLSEDKYTRKTSKVNLILLD